MRSYKVQMNTLLKYGWIRVLLLLGAFSFSISAGCSSKALKGRTFVTSSDKVVLKTALIKSESVLENIDEQAFGHFTNGVIAEQAGDNYAASREYRKALLRYPDSYEIRFSLANVQYRMQQFDIALKTLNTITQNKVELNNLRGICYRSIGDNENARKAYVESVKLDATDRISTSFLASEYRRLNDVDSLVWIYSKLSKINPNNYRTLVELGRFQIQTGKIDDALISFHSALELAEGRQRISSYLGLGDVYKNKNQQDSSVYYFKLAGELDPNNSYVVRELASYYSQKDSLSQAIYFAEKLVRLEPNNSAAKRFLSQLYVSTDSLPKAEMLLEDLLAAGDNDPSNYFYLGRIAIVKQDFESAKEYLTILTQLSPSVPDSWLDLGFVYRRTDNLEKAINVYSSGLQFVNHRADSVRLLFAIGASQESSKNIEQAEKTFEKIILLDPNHSQTLNYLGYMLADNGDRLEYAKDLIGKALELSPENAAYIDSYGWVMFRLGKYNDAVEYLSKAVSLQSDPVIYDHLGDAYNASGNSGDARIWWQKALELEPDNDRIREKLNE